MEGDCEGWRSSEHFDHALRGAAQRTEAQWPPPDFFYAEESESIYADFPDSIFCQARLSLNLGIYGNYLWDFHYVYSIYRYFPKR